MAVATPTTPARATGLASNAIAEWCVEAGVRHAIVGGFFVRPGGRPLGELRVDGIALDSEPFAPPWGGRRGSVAVDDGEVELAPRLELPRAPGGDLLEAGPLLLREGASVVQGVADPEGFSATAHQFDSDITDIRAPRSVHAINLDGGGSTSLVFDGILRNAPREEHGALIPGGRPVATGLAFRARQPQSRGR